MDLDAANEYFMRTSLWPAVLFTVLMMLIGIVGNALVLIIYRNDFHKSVTWIFIYFLSALDICTCLISMPSELTILVNMVSFPSWPWCKASRYLSYIFHGSSCVILMAIAFNRYDRVCRSSGQLVNIKKAKIACLGVFTFAIVVNIPSLFLYGEAKVPILIRENTAQIISGEVTKRYLAMWNQTRSEINDTISNPLKDKIIIGKMCLIKNEFSGSAYSMAFFFVQFLMYVTLVVLVVFFYSKVIRKMVGYRAKQEKLFSLYNSERKDSVKEEEETSTNRRLSEDVKSDTLCKDVTTDPLSQSIQNANQATGNAGKGKENVQKKEQNTADIKPATIADVSQQNTNGRPDITFPVSDAKNAGSDRLSEHFNPLQANKLLSRRIKSVESLSKAYTAIPTLVVPNMDINQNSKTLFLHANKTHKKRGAYVSDKRDDRKCNSDEQILLNTQDDLYLHKEQQNYGYGSKSVEVLSPSNINPLNLADKTMTINRKSPKGSMKCVLPISGLSVKSATSYSQEELNKEPQEDASPAINKSEPDDKINAPTSASETPEKTPTDEQCVDGKEMANGKKFVKQQSSVSFKVTEEGNSPRRSLKGRFSRLDSMSPMFDTPEGEGGSLRRRKRSRSDSLFSPSLKTQGYNRRMSIKPIKALRTSSMLLIISLAFVLSFLPFWIIVLLRSAIGAGFMSSLSPTGFGAVSIFIRSSLVSNAVNPIVYGLLNSQFRKRCKAIILRR